MTSAAVFAKVNNAILDLQNSQHQTYDLPLRTIARALSDPSLALLNSRLTAEVDLNEFTAASGQARRGQALHWLLDEEQRLGLVILLAQRMGDDPNFALNFGHAHFSNGSNKIIAGVHGFAGQVLAPFA